MNHRSTIGLAALLMAQLWVASIAEANEPITGLTSNSAVLEAAKASTEKGNYSLAVAQYTKALELDLKNVAAYLARGEAQRHLGEYEKAVLDYKQATQLDAPQVSKFFRDFGADKVRPDNQSFLLSIEDVFYITGRGVAAIGRVARGKIKVGDKIEVAGLRAAQITTVIELQSNRKKVEQVVAGDECLLLLKGIERKDIERGQTLVTPGSAVPASDFEARLYLFTGEQDGRKTPFFRNYRSQFYLRTVDVPGTILEVGGEGGVATPGEIVDFKANLMLPMVLEEGLRFAMREGGRVVGVGVVTKVKSIATP